MIYKIAYGAGHGCNTPGKRTPDDEREWFFNNAVVLAFETEMKKYKNVQLLRTDDPTGKTDVPLKTRTDKANNWGADIYISFHHNALRGIWGDHTGTETFYYRGSQNGYRLARLIQDHIVKAYNLRNRGLKVNNLHITRETKMPAVLIEGCFMDSCIDIKKLRDDEVLKDAGIRVSEAVAIYGELVKKKAPTYTVKKGDTLWAISREFNTTVEKLKYANNLTSDLINIGQELVVIGLAKPQPKPQPKPKSKPKANVVVDGYWGQATTRALQRSLGTPVDGVISGQYRNSVTNQMYSVKFSSGGSTVIRALQRKLGVTADGLIGAQTIRALQKHLGTPVDGIISKASMVVKEMQRRLNSGTL